MTAGNADATRRKCRVTRYKRDLVYSRPTELLKFLIAFVRAYIYIYMYIYTPTDLHADPARRLPGP